jgi:hypothetical protein
MRAMIMKVERLGQFSVLRDKLCRFLPNKRAGGKLGQHLQPLEHPIRFRDERFADVKAWKMSPFKESNLVSLLR